MAEKLLVQPFLRKNLHIIILFIIIATAGVMYFSSVTYGFPLLLHPDEYTIVDPAIELVKNHSLEPTKYNRPDHILIQISSILYTLFTAATGVPIAEIVQNNLWQLHMISRIVTVCFFLGSIFMAYKICARKSKLAGVVAAALLAFCPLFSRFSYSATSDVPTTFVMLVFMFFATEYFISPKIKNLLFMCLATAAFICIKYTGAILLLCIAVTVIVSAVKKKDYLRILKHALLTVALVFLFIFIISPKLILDMGGVIEALTFEARTTHPGADGLSWGGNMLFYITTYFGSTGIILAAFFALGIFSFVKKEQGIKWLPIFYGFIYWVALSYMPLHWIRWGLPMYISALLITALGIDYLYRKIAASAHARKKVFFGLYAACLVIVAVYFVSSSALIIFYQNTPTTRSAALEYCEENNITEENSLFETYTPFAIANKRQIFKYFKKSKGTYVLKKAYQKLDYILLSEEYNYRFSEDPEKYPKENAIYAEIREKYEPVAVFDGAYEIPESPVEILGIVQNFAKINEIATTGLTGGTIEIYKIPQ